MDKDAVNLYEEFQVDENYDKFKNIEDPLILIKIGKLILDDI